MQHTLFQIFSYSMWAALYLSVTVLIGQLLEKLSARYVPVYEREEALERLKARYAEARRILVEREVRAEASRIIAKLDIEDDARAFALDYPREVA